MNKILKEILQETYKNPERILLTPTQAEQLYRKLLKTQIEQIDEFDTYNIRLSKIMKNEVIRQLLTKLGE